MAYVYILRIEDLNDSGYIKKTTFYTGYTTRRITERTWEHINKPKGYLRRYHPHSRKILVYVEKVEFIPKDELPYFKTGKKNRAGRDRYTQYHPREFEIKKMPREGRQKLIESDRNELKEFKPNFGNPKISLKR